MLKHGQVVPMISSSLGYSGFIFHHQWLYDAKNPFVYAWQAAFHMWKIGVQHFSASVHGTQFPCFWIIPNDFKWYEIICWVTPNVSTSSFCIWHESSSNNASNFASSYTFGLPLCYSLSSTSNSPFLNFWNHSRQLLSLKTASPYTFTSNLWASAADFFKLKKKSKAPANDASAQNSIFSQKKIYDADTKSLIFQGYGVAGCPILRYVVLH